MSLRLTCDEIGHFRVPLRLCFKASLCVRNHSYENDFDLHEIKLHAELIFIWKVSHLDSFWKRGTRELGNGLLRPRPHQSVFKWKRSCFAPDTAIVHITTPKMITEKRSHSKTLSRVEGCFLKMLFSSVDGENNAIWKRWRHQNRHDQAPNHSIVSIQNGGQTLPCGFNFVPISRADILKCACVEFIWPCALRV